MFRVNQRMPHFEIKIPSKRGICFVDDGTVELAVKTGENAADIENLEVKTEEVAAAVEDVKQQMEWNDDRFKWMWDAIYDLQARVELLENQAAAEPEPTGTNADIVPDSASEETVIEGETPAEDVKEEIEDTGRKSRVGRKVWGLF